MKNFKKTISLILAICMIASLAISASAANTVDASGGTGTSSVTLSSTADGSIGGDPAATKMSVTVPTVLPIAVGTDGTVSTATDAKIVNNSFGAVKVNSVSIEAAQGWSLAAFGDKATLAHEKVNSNIAYDAIVNRIRVVNAVTGTKHIRICDLNNFKITNVAIIISMDVDIPNCTT